MNSLLNRIAVFAAGAVVFGTMAYGQTELKARIPFAFTSANGTLPAGEYTFNRLNNGGGVYTLRNAASKHTEFAVGTPNYSTASGSPAILFRCNNEGCALSGIRTYDGGVSRFGHSGSVKGREVAVLASPARLSNGD